MSDNKKMFCAVCDEEIYPNEDVLVKFTGEIFDDEVYEAIIIHKHCKVS